MELHKIETGNFMLDGGAMFGVVPKAIWSKIYKEEHSNLVNLCMRSLLVVDGNRKVLVDTGMGDKLSEKFLSYYFPNGDDSLLTSLEKIGFNPEDITDVVITHLHFDHVGGAVKRDGSDLKPTFPNAAYWVSDQQWQNAVKPNKLEAASFLADNFIPIQENDRLRTFDKPFQLTPHVELRIFHGHTKGLVVPFVCYNKKRLVYCADLIPIMGHVPPHYICAYDTQPLVSLQEKTTFLAEAHKGNYTLMFEHDIENECCTLKETEKGIRVDKVITFEAFKKGA